MYNKLTLVYAESSTEAEDWRRTTIMMNFNQNQGYMRMTSKLIPGHVNNGLLSFYGIVNFQ